MCASVIDLYSIDVLPIRSLVKVRHAAGICPGAMTVSALEATGRAETAEC